MRKQTVVEQPLPERRRPGNLSCMQLYRKIKKQGSMLYPTLEYEMKRRCNNSAYSALVTVVKPNDLRKAGSRLNWDSGEPKHARVKWVLTPHRATLLLLCACVSGEL